MLCTKFLRSLQSPLARHARLHPAAAAAAGGRSLSTTTTFNIAVLPGDGVGAEVVNESIKVLQTLESAGSDARYSFASYDIGGVAIDNHGVPLPDSTLEACRGSDAIMLGAVGGPKWDDPKAKVRPEQGLLKIRAELDLFANLRPIVFFKELLDSSPLRPEIVDGVDILFVRELTGGIYFGPREEENEGEKRGVAHDVMVYHDWEVDRIVRVAARAAAGRSGNLVSVDKANVLASSRLWRRVAEKVCAEPEYKNNVNLKHGLVDSTAMDLITNPKKFDVVVTENMFGDILTDEASVLSGSLGLLPSASLSDPGKPGMYEPIHGSAPDIANHNICNPIASILSTAMMLRHSLGLEREALAIENGVAWALRDGCRTSDLILAKDQGVYEPLGTKEMGDEIAKRITLSWLKLQEEGEGSGSKGGGSVGAAKVPLHLRSSRGGVRGASSLAASSAAVGGSRSRRSYSTTTPFSSSSSSPGSPRTMFDKIWDDHVVSSMGDDGSKLIYIDRHLVHEVTSPQAFEGLRVAGRSVRRPDRTLATVDHNVPTTKGRMERGIEGIDNVESRLQIQTLEKNVAEYGVEYFGMNDQRQGIVHVVGPEQGFTLPGMTVVCGDSHTATHGAFGALAFGIGTSEVEHVLATQSLVQKPAKNMLIRGLHSAESGNSMPIGLTSKDLVLHVCGLIGTAGGTGHVVEFAGDAFSQLSMEGRMTVCNMTIEAGARAGMIAPDDITYDYIRGRPMAPKEGEEWERALEYWSTLPSDVGAKYDTIVEFHTNDVAPQVTWGTSPEDVLPIDGYVPSPSDQKDPNLAASMSRSLEYMGLIPGQAMAGTPLDKVFIGSCTNSRIEDLRAVADVVRGAPEGARRVPISVEAMIVPGSGLVKMMAEDEGLDKLFVEAGFQWREPGCSMCLAMNDDKLAAGQRCASTSNRNFEGRQGTGGRTHLVSPAMAAAAALTGKLTDVRAFGLGGGGSGSGSSGGGGGGGGGQQQQRRGYTTTTRREVMDAFVSTTAVPAPMRISNVDTDMIIPAEHLKTIERTGLGKHAFSRMRYDADGEENESFVLNQPMYRGTSILLAEDNFGCGSSREHAPWALLDLGIKCVISTSFADIFFNNCFKNGILPIRVSQDVLDDFMSSADRCEELRVDLKNQTITSSAGNVVAFEVEEFRRHCLLNGLDDIALTLQKADDIDTYEKKIASTRPWV